MTEAMLIAHEFPGLGNPWTLAIDEWAAAVRAAVKRYADRGMP